MRDQIQPKHLIRIKVVQQSGHVLRVVAQEDLIFNDGHLLPFRNERFGISLYLYPLLKGLATILRRRDEDSYSEICPVIQKAKEVADLRHSPETDDAL